MQVRVTVAVRPAMTVTVAGWVHGSSSSRPSLSCSRRSGERPETR